MAVIDERVLLKKFNAETQRFINLTACFFDEAKLIYNKRIIFKLNENRLFYESMLKALYCIDITHERYKTSFWPEDIKVGNIPEFDNYGNIAPVLEKMMSFLERRDKLLIMSPEYIINQFLMGYDHSRYEMYKNVLRDIIEEREKINLDSIKSEYMANMDEDTYRYLETAAKYFIYIRKDNRYNVDECKLMSLFVALFNFDKIYKTDRIISILKNEINRHGISYDHFSNRVSMRILDVYPTDPSIVLYEYFSEYNGSSKSILDIYKKLFCDDKYNRSVLHSYLLSGFFNSSLEIVDDIYMRLLKEYKKSSVIESKPKYVDASNSSNIRAYLNKRVYSYLVSCAKYYTLIKNGRNSYGLLKNENDYVDVAGILASYYTTENIFSLKRKDYNELKKICGFDSDVSSLQVCDEFVLETKFFPLLRKIHKNLIDITVEDVEQLFSSTYRRIEIEYDNEPKHSVDRIIGILLGNEESKFRRPERPVVKEPTLDEIFSDMPEYLIEYFTYVSKIYKKSIAKFSSHSDLESALLLLGVYYLKDYKDGKLIEYLNSLGLTKEKIIEYFDMKNLPIEEGIDIKTINYFVNLYSPKISRAHSIEDVLSKLNVSSVKFRGLLRTTNLSEDDLRNISDNLEKYKVSLPEDSLDYFRNNKDFKDLIIRAYIIMGDLVNISNKNDRKSLGLLISYLMTKNTDYYDKVLQSRDLFEKAGLSLSNILNKIGYEPSDLSDKPIDEKLVISEMKDAIIGIGECDEGMFSLARYIMGESSLLFKKLISDKEIYDKLEYGINNEESFDVDLPLDVLYRQLKELKENRIVVSTENYKGMKDFATNENLALKKCSEYINKKRSSISRYSSVNKLIGILIDKCNAFIEVHHPSLLGRITNRHYTEYSIEEIQDIINSINDILENMPIFLNELINLSNAYGMYLKEIDYYLGISITIKSYTDTFALEDNEKMHDLYNLISGKNMSLEQKQQLVTGEKASVRNQIIKYNDIKECLDSLSDKLSYGINTGEYTLDMYLAIIREIIEKITFSDESSITKTEGKKK